MIQILEAATKLTTSNPMGRVSAGHICLRGWLLRITLHCDEIADENLDYSRDFRISADVPYKPNSIWLEWFCLPILRRENEFNDEIKGLVLERTPKGKIWYRRVGVFTADDDYYEYFNRPTYPASSKYPTDGTTTASMSDILSEMGTDGSIDESTAAEQAANARKLREGASRQERGNITNAIDTKVGWVESIITII